MLILGNGRVLKGDESLSIEKDAALAISGEHIEEIGPTAELREKYPEAEYKDLEDKLVLPGMINTHMHLYSTFARGMDLKTDQPPSGFVEILEKLWWRLDKSLNAEDIYYSALYALMESVCNGCTTIFDHHASYGMITGSLDIIARAVKEVGLRASLSYEVSDRWGRERAQKALKENKRFIKNLDQENSHYLQGLIGLHASFTLEDRTLEEAASLSEELNTPFHLHTAEGWADVDHSKDKGYQGVVDRLNEYNIWQPGTMAIHGVHLEKGEAEILRDQGSYLIHNPESNMGNGVGTPDLEELLRKRLTVGMGTDGYTTDIFEGLNVAGILQSHEKRDPRAGGSAGTIVLENNKKIARHFFADKIGALIEGAPADLIVVDYFPPTPLTADNLTTHLAMGINGAMVESTMVGGTFLYEDREVKCIDRKKVSTKTRRQARGFWKRF